jgi:hypothetical protein
MTAHFGMMPVKYEDRRVFKVFRDTRVFKVFRANKVCKDCKDN